MKINKFTTPTKVLALSTIVAGTLLANSVIVKYSNKKQEKDTVELSTKKENTNPLLSPFILGSAFVLGAIGTAGLNKKRIAEDNIQN